MMAWLGTALKSSQPRRSASCRSARPMVRITGVEVASGAPCVSCVTFPGYEVAMVVVSLKAYANSPRRSTVRVSLQRIRITLKPDARAKKLVLPRPELSSYAEHDAALLTV